MLQHEKTASGEQGFVLLEALIAILIFSFGVLGIVGLQAAMIKNTSDAKYRLDASFVAQQRISQMWADPATTNAGGFLEANTPVNSLPGGVRTVVRPVLDGPFLVTVGWTNPGEAQDPTIVARCGMQVAHCFSTAVRIEGA